MAITKILQLTLPVLGGAFSGPHVHFSIKTTLQQITADWWKYKTIPKILWRIQQYIF